MFPEISQSDTDDSTSKVIDTKELFIVIDATLCEEPNRGSMGDHDVSIVTRHHDIVTSGATSYVGCWAVSCGKCYRSPTPVLGSATMLQQFGLDRDGIVDLSINHELEPVIRCEIATPMVPGLII